jgi:hypothetical protein
MEMNHSNQSKTVEVIELAATGQVRCQVRPERGLHCPTELIISDRAGFGDFHFDLRGDKWRLACVENMGGISYPRGEGCDASGWVIPTELVDTLDALAFS